MERQSGTQKLLNNPSVAAQGPGTQGIWGNQAQRAPLSPTSGCSGAGAGGRPRCGLAAISGAQQLMDGSLISPSLIFPGCSTPCPGTPVFSSPIRLKILDGELYQGKQVLIVQPEPLGCVHSCESPFSLKKITSLGRFHFRPSRLQRAVLSPFQLPDLFPFLWQTAPDSPFLSCGHPPPPSPAPFAFLPLL